MGSECIATNPRRESLPQLANLARMQPRLIVVGFGNVGQAIVRGAIASGLDAPSEIGALDSDPARCIEAQELGIRVATKACLADAEVIVLAVKPQSFIAAAESLAPIGADGPLVVSVMAGLRSASIRQALGGHARVIRVMPNTPAAVRRGITAIANDSGLSAADVERAEQLFASVGKTVRVPEHLFDAVTAASGSGPAFVFRFLEAWMHAAETIGLPPEAAEMLARETLIGSAVLLDDTRERPEVLRAKVTSKGGTTAAGMVSLDASLDALVISALTAARDRGAEIGR